MMPLKSIIRLGLSSLFASRLRSLLSMLGIIIGVGSVIASLSLGESLRMHTLEQIRKMGTNLMLVVPTQKKVRGIRQSQTESLSIEDAKAILDLKMVQAVSPVVSSGFQLKSGGRNRNAMVLGVAPAYAFIHKLELEAGRFLRPSETTATDLVAVLGANVAQDLFPLESALGKNFRIQNKVFLVVGVLKRRGEEGMSPDDTVLTPYTTLMRRVMGRDSLQRIDVSAVSEAEILRAEAEVQKLLLQRHQIRSNEEPDFRIVNMNRIMETFNMLGFWFTVFLGCMAAISLLVGGIGIMNIMLVTVTERTAEIGVRKAIGARDSDILRQFLLEAVVMTACGGLTGTFSAILLLQTVGWYFSLDVVIPMFSLVLGLGFSTVIGVFFGYYPALRASRLNPIDCLRYE